MADIKSTEEVREEFKYEKHVLDDDYPGHTREIQHSALVRALTDFVREMADKHSMTAEERKLAEYEVALKLLTPQYMAMATEVGRVRLKTA